MIIVLKPETSDVMVQALLARIADAGLKPLHLPGTERTVLGAIGDERILGKLHLENDPAVERITPVLTPYKFVSREAHPANTLVPLGDIRIGGSEIVVIAGPCAVESLEQMQDAARCVAVAGAQALRGGAFKPRTSPYSFQGLGREGLEILRAVALAVGLPTVTEVVEVADVALVEEYADAFQIGARNMQNFRLLQAVGRARRTVILKRGMAATLEDLLLAAEYIVTEGNPNVVLCERGIRTFESATRATLDLSAVPYLKQHSHLPVLVDPSHGTGLRELVPPMAQAAVACGADGLLIEVHPNPAVAISDGRQSLFPDQFQQLMRDLAPFAAAAGRSLPLPRRFA